jgi:Ca2+-binding EF-hand superfamily protein
MDKDGDGALSADEVDDHVIGDAFDILDDDKDGSVSSGEFTSQMNDDFDAADQDGDGMLK